MKVRTIISITLLFLFTKSLAQKKVTTQSLLWAGFSFKAKVSDKWSIRQELDERTYWFPWRQHMFLARTHAELKLGKGWDVAPGFAYVVQALPNDPSIKEYSNHSELRPQFEIANRQPLFGKVYWSNRYWTEFRFPEQEDHSFRYSGIRFRYKLGLDYACTEQLTFKVFNEIHVNASSNITRNVFDQNWAGGSIQYNPVKDLGLELGYMNIFLETASGDNFFSRNVVRFTIHKAFDFSKKKSNTKKL